MINFQTNSSKKTDGKNYDPASVALVMGTLSAKIETPIRRNKEHEKLDLGSPTYLVKIHPLDDLVFTKEEVSGSLTVTVVRSHDVLHVETVEFTYIKEGQKVRFYRNTTPLTKPESFFALIETGVKK